jgi:hypothetical protein
MRSRLLLEAPSGQSDSRDVSVPEQANEAVAAGHAGRLRRPAGGCRARGRRGPARRGPLRERADDDDILARRPAHRRAGAARITACRLRRASAEAAGQRPFGALRPRVLRAEPRADAGLLPRLADSAGIVCEIATVAGSRSHGRHFAGGACEIARRPSQHPTALPAALDSLRQVAGGQEHPRPCFLRDGGTPWRLDEPPA